MNRITTVVIDDEYFNRSLITMLISRFKSNFDLLGEAGNLRDGYNLILKHQPNVVFVDIKMPDGSGFDLINKFENKEFEVIFISGFDNYQERAASNGAIDYILKPIDLDQFKAALDKVESKINSNRYRAGKTDPPKA